MFQGQIESINLEAIAHGLRDAIIKQSDYHTLSQCESVDDVKSYLSTTDYQVCLTEIGKVTPRVLFERIQNHIVEEFYSFRNNSVEPLSTFLDFIAWEYMITNIIKLLACHRGDGGGDGKSGMEALHRCHPLGTFPGMSVLLSCHSLDDMFQAVLLESPVGRFFGKASGKDFEELSIEYVRSMLYKEWLQQFYDYCQTLGGVTAEIMGELLQFEADRFTLTVTLNTLSLKGYISESERRSLYPNIGKLTDISDALARVETEDELRERLKVMPEYLNILDANRSMSSTRPGNEAFGGSDASKSIERLFREKFIELNATSFHQQDHYAIFYSYFKLKEMENENILWISECIAQNMRHRILDFTPIF